MKRKDILITIVIGIFTALVWISVFLRLGTFDQLLFPGAAWGLLVIIPLGFIFGLYLGQWLSKWFSFFASFAKFVMTGFLNSGIDFAVFNLLMGVTKVEQGPLISSFKTVSFVVAVVNSYIWNKYWAFNADSDNENKGKEFFKFITVNVVGALINVGITSVIIFTIPPQLGLSQLVWNNIAAVVATAIALIWNFVAFRLIVFKKNEPGTL